MPLTLTGTLKDPYGTALPSAVIRFDATRTSETVLAHTSAEATTDAQGAYSITAELGRYDIRVKTQAARVWVTLAKGVLITTDTTATDLNALLVEWQGGQEATPAVLIEIQEAVAEAKGYRDQAATSETNAFNSAQAAAGSATEAGASADLAAQNAAAHYPSVADGLAGTVSGQYFRVPEAGYLQLYRNESGAAAPVLKLASQEELAKLNARPDPLLTSLLF